MAEMASLQDLLVALPAARLAGNAQCEFDRVHSDSRSVRPGDLFVALRGARFDALDFLAQAAQAGAVAALCEGDRASASLQAAGLSGLVVEDTKAALGALATHWRARFALPLIAVTGSNGKTTVTQMIAAILRAWQGSAGLATLGNFNNDIGVPLTLLRLRGQHRAAVIELGMNHPGEIAALAAMAQPTVALVNNAQREHLEFMDTVEAVALENACVIDALPADGIAVYPANDRYSALWRRRAGTRASWCFAMHAPSTPDIPTVSCESAHWHGAAWQVQARTPHGRLEFALHIAGVHNVKNALAAAACALGAGVPLQAVCNGLQQFEAVQGRSRSHALQVQGRSITLVDDTYNANPDSVRAAIEVLSDLPAPHLLVLGDMGEVGEQGAQFHAEALHYASQKNIEKVLVTGTAFAQAATNFVAVECYPEIGQLQSAVRNALPQSGSVLIKGSRFMRLERVVEGLLQAHAPSSGGVPCC